MSCIPIGWLSAVATLSILAAVPAQAVWQVASPTQQPTARAGHAMVHDSDRDVIVLFGGTDATGQRDDTWEWDGQDWRQRNPATRPPATTGHAMAYDRVRHRVVLFGGSNNNDTWEYDGANWTRQTPANSPSPRQGHAMSFDAELDEVLLFGGLGSTGALADTYSWDGANWTQRNPTPTPPARHEHVMASSPAGGWVYVFGGLDNASQPLGDTWVWNQMTWLNISGSSPAPGAGHAMAYHDSRDRLVLAREAPGSDQTWEWGGIWQATAGLPAQFHVRDHAMAYHRGTDALVAFGGRDVAGTLSNGTLEYVSVNPAALVSYGDGCPGYTASPTLEATGLSLPWLGDTLSLRIGPVPNGALAFLLIGWTNTSWNGQPLPANLGPFGVPQCQLLVRPDVSLYVLGAVQAYVGLTTPFSSSLTGGSFHLQGALLGAPRSNLFGLDATNALTATLGWR